MKTNSIQLMTRDAAGQHVDKVVKRLAEIRERGMLYRDADVVAVDVEARTVELSFSSEIEYQRWFGIEVLDHSPGAVKLDRLNDKAALLWNHNWDDMRGVVEPGTARVDGDRKGRAVVRFSRSEDGEQLLQDVADGIVTKVSVGYMVHGIRFQESREETDVYLVTEWEPYEISLVSVPADPSVGVGRSMEIPQEEKPAQAAENTNHRNNDPADQPQKGTTMNVKNLRDASGNLVRAEVDEAGNIVKVLEVLEKAGDGERSHVQRGQDMERARIERIHALGLQYDQRDLALEAIAKGKSVDDFQRELLDAVNKRGERKSSPAWT